MQKAHSLLDKLVGQWELTGKMGDIPLRQDVSARWVLGNRYVSLYFKSRTADDNPTADYEAFYHIGFNGKEEIFVFHLLDSTGVPVECDMGRGKREGNQISFLFEYGETQFFNILTWHPEDSSWTFRQEYQEEGELRVFAHKEMVKLT